MLHKPAPLTVSQTLYRCLFCRTPQMESEITTNGRCFSCGSTRVQPGFRFTDDEIAAVRDRGFVADETNFTYVPDRLAKAGILPGIDQLFRED